MPTKRYIKYSKVKWSHENKGCAMHFGETATNTFYQAGSVVVPASATQGNRTVGNWAITIPVPNDHHYFWALVFVPQGTLANNLFNTAGGLEGSLYEPNQFVIASGCSDGNAGPIRIRSKMKRTLQSNDFISLIVACQDADIADQYAQALVSYSVKYN